MNFCGVWLFVKWIFAYIFQPTLWTVFYGLFSFFLLLLLRYRELLNYYTTVGTLAFHNSHKIEKHCAVGSLRLLDGVLGTGRSMNVFEVGSQFYGKLW